MHSLLRQLVFRVLSMVFIAWFITAAITYGYATRVVVHQIDYQLNGFISMTHSVLSSLYLNDPHNLVNMKGRLQQENDFLRLSDSNLEEEGVPAINMWIDDKHIVLGAGAPSFPAHGDDLTIFHKSIDGTVWRVVYSYKPSSKIWIAAGLNIHKAEIAAIKFLTDLMLPVIFILPLTGLGIYLGTRRGLLPLRQITEQVGQRSASALTAIDIDSKIPIEISPLLEELNRLLSRVDASIDSEKRFTSNAAHELQTPLAAIKSEVQLSMRHCQDEATRDSLVRITERVDRASHSVKQLLTLARLDPNQTLPSQQLSLAEIVTDTLAEFATQLSQRGISTKLQITPELRVWADRESLLILLRNVVSNIGRYALENTAIEFIASQQELGWTLQISNFSECLTEEDGERLGERFYRPAHHRQQGAGLGLSIATRIAELHGGTLSIDSDIVEQKFTANIFFPNNKDS